MPYEPVSAPLITICIPACGRAGSLRSALESCLNQTSGNYEIIVSDDTEDNSVQWIVDAFDSPKIQYVHNEPPLGYTARLNSFASLCRSEWMLILCDDDTLEPGYIETITRHIGENPDVALIRCRNRLVDEAGSELCLDRESPVRSSPFEFLQHLFRPELRSFRSKLSAIAFRPPYLAAAGGFKDNYQHRNRMMLAGICAQGDVLCAPEVLANLRVQDSNVPLGHGSVDRLMVAESLSMLTYMNGVFATMRDGEHTEAQSRLLDEAAKQLTRYVTQSIESAIDAEVMEALEPDEKGAIAELQDAQERMRRRGIDTFPSMGIYRLAASLPLPLRAMAMRGFRHYKARRQLRG